MNCQDKDETFRDSYFLKKIVNKIKPHKAKGAPISAGYW